MKKTLLAQTVVWLLAASAVNLCLSILPLAARADDTLPPAVAPPNPCHSEGAGPEATSPRGAATCGAIALINLGHALKGSAFDEGTILRTPAPAAGFSMQQLAELSRAAGVELVPVRWNKPDEIPIPSIIHWRWGHYSALVAADKAGYVTVDPLFSDSRLSPAQIAAQGSGCFLLPGLKAVPSGWQTLLSAEAAQLTGRFVVLCCSSRPGPNGFCPDTGDSGGNSTGGPGTGQGSGPGSGGWAPGDSAPIGCTSCPGGGGGGGDPSGPSGPHPFPPSQPPDDCQCNGPGAGGGGGSASSSGGGGGRSPGVGGRAGGGGVWGESPLGMPRWTVSEPYIDLTIHDEPLGYQPALGRRVSFHLYYGQRAIQQPQPWAFNVGTNWDTYWLNYVTDADTSPGATPMVTCTIFGNTNRIYSTNASSAEFFSDSRMERLTNSSGVFAGFKASYPSGAIDFYTYITNTTPPSALRTEMITSGGQSNRFEYTNSAGIIQLVRIVDGDGRTNYVSYTNTTYRAQITEVQDAFGRKAELLYDSSGRLTNITDVAGLSSAFQYDEHSWITNMVTPYGPTAFNIIDRNFGEVTPGGTNEINRAIEATLPDGGKELYMYRDMSQQLGQTNTTQLIPDIITGDQVPTSSPVGTLDNTNMSWRNSFHWNRLQYSHLSNTNMFLFTTNDYNLAHMKHWLLNRDWNVGDNKQVMPLISMQRQPCPDPAGTYWGQTTWYDYYGKIDPFAAGTNSRPDAIIRMLPDDTEWYVLYQRNEWGQPTNVVETYSGGSGTRTTAYVYDSNGIDLLQVIGPDTHTRASYSYDGNHHVEQAENAVSEVTYFSYNSSGQITSVKTPAGLTTTNIYLTSGTNANWLDRSIDLEIQRTNSYTWTNDLVSTHTDERGLTTTYAWDNLQRVTSASDPRGAISYTYDKLDLVRTVDRMGFTNSFTYDALRRLTAQTNALGQFAHYAYCTCGALDSIQDAAGNYTRFYYDNAGRRTNIVYADTFTVNYRYNLLGQLTNVADSAGTSVTNWFNTQGLPVTVSNAFGQVKGIGDDINDRPMSSTNANGVEVDSTFDDLGRVLTRLYPDSGVEKFGYSARGLTAYVNQLSLTNFYGYDQAGRKTSETNANQEITQFTYTPAGDLWTLADGKNQTTTWYYDAYGRVTNKWDATNTLIFAYAYDANNRLTNRWTPAKNNTGYGYDALGNLTSIAYPVSAAITLHYDALNRVTNMVDAAGTTTYGYDAAGQLLSEDGPWPDDTVSYTYNNRLRASVSVLAPNVSAWAETYGYDTAKRLTNAVSPTGSFGYTYDPVRHMQTGLLTLPNGAYITNTYDSVARLLSTTLIDSRGTNLDSYTYTCNQASQRTNMLRTAGDYVNYTYDNIGQLQTAKGKESGGTTNRLNEQLGYTYDAAGNLNWRTNNALVEAFNVNSLNELTTATNSGTLTVAGTTTSGATNVTVNGLTASRYFDATFAKDGFTVANGTNTFTAIAKDAYGRRDTNTINCYLPATNNFTYDSNGNLVSDGRRAFDYDDENQLVRVTVTNAWKSEFVYDGKMRRRIRAEYTWNGSTWVTNQIVRYVYDGNLVIQERDGNNLPLVTYTRGRDLSGSLEGAGGIGGLLARTDNRAFAIRDSNAHAYYHADGNGNITCLINASQSILARYLYDSYGNILSQSGPLAEANLYRFSSKEFHVASGLVYYLYRFYEPNLQRWINRDPIEEEGGVSLYRFVGNNPISRVDALGLATPEQIEELKREIELIQRMRELAQQMIANLENCKGQCLGVASPVAYYCSCFRDNGKNCEDFAACICVQLPDDIKCKNRARKACEIFKKVMETYEKAKGKGY